MFLGKLMMARYISQKFRRLYVGLFITNTLRILFDRFITTALIHLYGYIGYLLTSVFYNHVIYGSTTNARLEILLSITNVWHNQSYLESQLR